MKPIAWRWIIAVIIGATLGVWLGNVSRAQERELPACQPGIELAVGTLTASDHEAEEGYWGVGQHLALTVRPEGISSKTLQRLRGEEVILSIRLRLRQEARIVFGRVEK